MAVKKGKKKTQGKKTVKATPKKGKKVCEFC